MENASKAFLIAGGVLIAILILSLGVYLFTTYSQLGTTYEGTIQENEIKKFNSNFTKFEGRTDITAQEIITAINFSKEYEANYGITTGITISGASPWTVDNINREQNGEIDFIKYCNEKNCTFKCNLIYDNTTGLIEKATFTKMK